MKTIFITGSNRGIGLELTRQCLQRGDKVFASCRNPDEATQLIDLRETYPERLNIIHLDVANEASIGAAAAKISELTERLDILINNAGVLISAESVGNLDAQSLLNVLHINSVGPLMVAQSLLDLLKAGKDAKIVNITSQLGSISRKRSGGHYSYDGSKAALNMFSRTLAFDVIADGIITIVMHPGWVRTDMGGSRASISVEESTRGILQVTEQLTKDDVGRFLQWDGAELPW